MGRTTASYQDLDTNELSRRVEALSATASPCRLCPRACLSLRRQGEVGYCRTAFVPVVSSASPHFGEESPISGTRGSGTIFLTGCNLRCVFCQNHDISQEMNGVPTTVEGLAAAMVALQGVGCHNVNLVTPTHQMHSILAALVIARSDGLHVPLVYNSGGYDEVEALKALDGIIDIYMPDLKFMDRTVASDLADAPDYPDRAKAAIREMHRQVGDLSVDGDGVARRGLLVRHLVLPHGLAGSAEAFRFLAEEVSPRATVNVMAQYRPCWHALGRPLIGDCLTSQEYLSARREAARRGLTVLD